MRKEWNEKDKAIIGEPNTTKETSMEHEKAMDDIINDEWTIIENPLSKGAAGDS